MDSIEQAQKVMEQILAEHPLVLQDPEPAVTVNELADSSVNFNCRPWVKPERLLDCLFRSNTYS